MPPAADHDDHCCYTCTSASSCRSASILPSDSPLAAARRPLLGLADAVQTGRAGPWWCLRRNTSVNTLPKMATCTVHLCTCRLGSSQYTKRELHHLPWSPKLKPLWLQFCWGSGARVLHGEASSLGRPTRFRSCRFRPFPRGNFPACPCFLRAARSRVGLRTSSHEQHAGGEEASHSAHPLLRQEPLPGWGSRRVAARSSCVCLGQAT